MRLIAGANTEREVLSSRQRCSTCRPTTRPTGAPAEAAYNMTATGSLATALILAMMIVQTLTCPTTICTCSVRGTVICSGKRLERIPYFAREPGRVYDEIDLSRNEIFAVPPYAFDSVQTRSLVLAHNPLIGVSPRAFAGLGRVLERLDVSDCELPVLHWAAFRQLSRLVDINLARNSLFAVPRGLFLGLTALHNLTLASNRLSSVRHGVFTGLRTLRRLDLSDNVISAIEPGAFEACRQLTTLDLTHNRFHALDINSFRSLENLQRLSLASNQLTDVDTGVFFAVRALVELDLSSNNLTIIGPKQFSGSPRLERINLAKNAIWNVSVDSFHGLVDMRSVYLDRNRLQTLDSCLFAGLSRNMELSVSGNPVSCSCDDGRWVDEARTSVTLVGECWEPPARRGLPLALFNTTSCPSRGTDTQCRRT